MNRARTEVWRRRFSQEQFARVYNLVVPKDQSRNAIRRVAAGRNAKARIGVDTGGTFTDFASFDGGKLTIGKERSTPDDPSRSILAGLNQRTSSPAMGEVIHGTTVATNAVLERKGSRVALLTTAGFEDVLRIGRQTRPELYNFLVTRPVPLVASELVFGVAERITAEGEVLIPLESDALNSVGKALLQLGVEIVAICFLHSYLNPAHEQLASKRLRKLGLRVCASHEILPEYREFERTSTTTLNAYVTPLMDRYLHNLELGLAQTRLLIMQSNGGSISAGAARAQAVRTLLSGPAAGVVGARAVARQAGFHRIISFDMGGTSTDVSLIDGAFAWTTDSVISGLPVRLPTIDIHTVGAGGGSIATVDSGGALRVGPQSAGGSPGPACYGVGNELTVTDANLLIGRLDPNYFLGGRMTLHAGRSLDVAKPLARKLKLEIAELAEGIIRVANANMERAIRVVSVERGHDPREFALLAFGGAGGMHACEIANGLEIRTVLVPRHAGVLSALGMLLADVSKDYSTSVLRRSDGISIQELRKKFAALLDQAKQALKAEGFPGSRQVLEKFIDLRYTGQSYEITLPFSLDYQEAFHRQHLARFGYANSARAAEVVSLRVRASGITEKPRIPKHRPTSHSAEGSCSKEARFNGRPVQTAFYRWDALSPGSKAHGPCVITGAEATIAIPPGWKFRMDAFGNVIAEKQIHARRSN